MIPPPRRSISLPFNRSYGVRAVGSPDVALHGFVRMKGKRGSVKVEGFCGFFQAGPEGVFFDSRSLFFYGTVATLAKNYRREPPFSNEELAGFSDKPYATASTGTPLEPTLRKAATRYKAIPLDQMQLRPNQNALLEMLIKETEAKLPQWIRTLRTVEVAKSDASSIRGLRRSLSRFPNELKLEAQETESYYTTNFARQGRDSESAVFPATRIILTPMGGLPRWAKVYMRRARGED